ncbi:MAG TPA: EAL domain-containing protein [Candidatus Baltobacteraceae bacterium]
MPSSMGANGSPFKTGGIIAGFLILWIAGDVAAQHYVNTPGYSPWYIGGALDLALFYAFGARWWPLVVVADLLRGLIFDGPGMAWVPLRLEHGIISGLGYAGAYLMLTGPLAVTFSVRTARDAALFVLVAAVLAPAVIAMALTPFLVANGTFPRSDAPVQFARFVVGDGIGTIALFPALVILLEWVAGDRTKFDPHVEPSEFWLAAACTVGAVLVAYALAPGDVGAPLLAIPFLPMAWLAIRAGIVGASIGILVADATATVLQIVSHAPSGGLIVYQSFIATSGVMAIVLGAIACERNRLERRLRRRAETDALTGLPNHSSLIDWMLRRGDKNVALVVADVDDMRLLNEGVGRSGADTLLSLLGERLAAVATASSIVARVSADEFALVSEAVHDIDAMTGALHACVEQPFTLAEARIYLSLSLGVSVGPGRDPDVLIRAADAAVDRAKATHRREVIYTGDADTARGQTLLGELHRAADEGEFVSFYQPIYRRANGRWKFVGAEALMRWDHPERGILKPAAFLHLLERLALGERVGWTTIESNIAQVKRWREIDPDFTMWVNVFDRQLHDPKFKDRLLGLLAAQGVPPSALIVEINETIVTADEAEIGEITQGLRDGGIRVAIDDFGTGGSSLGRLRDTPADVLKIDRSFVARCEIDPRARAVVQAVMRLARDVDLEVVAEGVENAMQLSMIESLGCELVQGYALAHPMPAERIDGYLAEARSASA